MALFGSQQVLHGALSSVSDIIKSLLLVAIEPLCCLGPEGGQLWSLDQLTSPGAKVTLQGFCSQTSASPSPGLGWAAAVFRLPQGTFVWLAKEWICSFHNCTCLKKCSS